MVLVKDIDIFQKLCWVSMAPLPFFVGHGACGVSRHEEG